jgi:dienelactone hydrolase
LWAVVATWQFAGLAHGQQVFGDLRNLDDTYVKSHFAPPTYRTLDEWRGESTRVRQQILASAGLIPYPERNRLNARRTSRKWHGTFYIEKVEFEPLPGFHLAGNLYVPVNASATHKVPGVLVPHGHWKHGRAHQAEIYSVPALCANLAEQGYVAFAYDMIGYGDTHQLPHHFGGSSSEQLWSFSSMGLQLWDSIRSVDFLESLAEVDADRIGIAGASGGGTQAFLLTAVDDRIKASAPVDMVSATFQGDDTCEVNPGLRIGTNNVEIAAMMAPRPMLLVASTRDWSKNTPTEEFPSIRSIYSLFGRPDQVGFAQVDAEHNFNQASREAVYSFFAKFLKGVADKLTFKETFTETLPNDELVFGDKPEHLIGTAGYDQIFAGWREAAQRQTQAMSRKELRDRMQVTIGTEWPDAVQTLFARDQLLLSRGKGDRVPAQWLPGTVMQTSVLVINPDGSDSARKSAFVRDAQVRGLPTLMMDVYQTGAAQAPIAARLGDSLTFHRTDDEYRVQDILTGIAWLHERSRTVKLHCNGRASSWCLLAASVSPVPVVLDIEPVKTPSSDEDLKRLMFVPGLQRAGGMRVVHMLAEPMTDLLTTVTENGLY